jgi:sulfite reductase alpha subunit-like flavoprotein
VAGLPDEAAVLFVVATAGQGDPPDNLRRFWRFLMRAALPSDALAGLPFAVLGLGDSGYPNYNTVAKKLHARLGALGGRAVCPPALADDQAAGGPDEAFDAWLPGLWPALRAGVRAAPPVGRDTPPDGDVGAGLGACRFAVEVVEGGGGGEAPPPATTTLEAALAAHAAFAALDASSHGCGRATGHSATASTASVPGSSPAHPTTAAVAANERLTAPDHWQHTARLGLSLPAGTAFDSAEPGDVLAVLPPQDPGAVAALLARVGVPAGSSVRVSVVGVGGTENGRSGGAPPPPPPPSITLPATDLVSGVLALSSTPPRRTCVQLLAAWAADAKEADRLAHLASADGRDDLHRYAVAERRGLASILADFPSVRPPLAWLLALGPRLQPRRFSLASDVRRARRVPESSTTPSTTDLDLLIAAVEWTSPCRRRVRGLASTWLTGLRPGTALPVWWERGSLRSPPPGVPLILVGPGTGVAPLRALLQRRAADLASATAAGAHPLPPPSFLFFGCRAPDADYYFRTEWEAAVAAGVLDGESGLHAAFSRAPGLPKTYVGDAIRAASGALWRALVEQGAWVYVCGSARKMPGDVADAFAGVAAAEGGLDEAGAKGCVRRLQAQGRYWVEAWA